MPGRQNPTLPPALATRAAGDTVPAHKLAAAKAVLAEREAELLALKGPCSNRHCRLHYAHGGPCNTTPTATHGTANEPATICPHCDGIQACGHCGNGL